MRVWLRCDGRLCRPASSSCTAPTLRESAAASSLQIRSVHYLCVLNYLLVSHVYPRACSVSGFKTLCQEIPTDNHWCPLSFMVGVIGLKFRAKSLGKLGLELFGRLQSLTVKGLEFSVRKVDKSCIFLSEKNFNPLCLCPSLPPQIGRALPAPVLILSFPLATSSSRIHAFAHVYFPSLLIS